MTVGFRTALTELLGIEHPILLAPMGMVAGGELAAAVTRAGGLGLIGVGYSGEEWIDRQFDAAGNTRVGIGFITWHLAQSPRRLEAALARKPSVVMLSFGDPAPFVPAIRAAGAKLILQVQSIGEATEAARLGADAVVVQGVEAGGHGADPGASASRSLMPLIPAAADAIAPVPVVAAGGIADGRGLAAALTLGAAGILVGTRFFAATESLGHPNAKARLVAQGGDATVRTRIFDIVRKVDWPERYTGRALVNEFARRWHGHDAELCDRLGDEQPRYAAAAAAGDISTMVVFAGEGVDLIRSVEPARAIVERMVTEARTILDRLSGRR
ncbi:MAG: nitronate monooxygenase [Alphaproteobacteria bacterium]|nr:nitronate monooxygenase [Alphaproteobacteria bacterium]